MGRKSVLVLELLAREGELSAKEIAERLGFSLSETYRLIRELRRMGLAEKSGRKYRLREPFPKLISYIVAKYRLDAVAEGNCLKVLSCLLNPNSIRGVAECSSLSEKTVRKIVGDLVMRGIVEERDGEFEVVGDPILRTFIYLLKNISLGLEDYAYVAYMGSTFIIKVVPKDKPARGEKTAFSVFEKFSLGVETPHDYYVYPPVGVGVEEAIIHSLLVARDRYERTLIALLYLKNYGKVNREKLMDLASRLRLVREVKELDGYISGRHSPLFLPHDEFARLARTYGLDPFRYFERRFSPAILERIGSLLKEDAEALLIGGGAMVLKGYKVATVDVDIIVRSEEELKRIEDALVKLNYSLRARNLALVYSDDGPSIDIYLREIPGKFVLHSGVLSRAEVRKFGRLKVYVASDTHIFLMKAAAGRPKDMDDLVTLVRKGRVDWRLLAEELEVQDGLLEEPISPRVLRAMRELERMLGARIPMMRKVKSIALRNYATYLVRRGVRDARRLAEEVGVSEDVARRKLREVERELKAEREGGEGKEARGRRKG